jgi:hypothetical protein
MTVSKIMCDVTYGRDLKLHLLHLQQFFFFKKFFFRFLLLFSEMKDLAPIFKLGPFQGRVERSNRKGGRHRKRSLLQLLSVRAISPFQINRFAKIHSATWYSFGSVLGFERSKDTKVDLIVEWFDKSRVRS